MNSKVTILYVILFLKILLILDTEDAYAYELGYLAEASTEYTDNIGRERENPEEETINTIAGGIVFLENSERLDVLFDLTASRLYFKNNPDENQVVYELVTNAEWRVFRDVLTFRLDDVFDRVRIDSSESDTPDNQEDVNVFSAGPELTLALGPSNDFVAEYRYLNNYYEVSDADSEGSLGILRFIHQSTPESTISINYEENRLYYEDPEEAPDYVTRSLFLEYQRETGTNQFTFEIGQSLLQTDGSEDTSATIGAVRYERIVNPETRWLLGYSRAYANSTDVITVDQGELDTEAGVVFLIDRATAGLASENLYRAQAVYVHGTSIQYEQENELYDSDVVGARVAFRENFGRDMSLELEGTWDLISYAEFPRQDREATAHLTYNYEFQRNMFLRLAYERESRESTLWSEEYITNIYRLSLAYDSTDVAARALPGAFGRPR